MDPKQEMNEEEEESRIRVIGEELQTFALVKCEPRAKVLSRTIEWYIRRLQVRACHRDNNRK